MKETNQSLLNSILQVVSGKEEQIDEQLTNDKNLNINKQHTNEQEKLRKTLVSEYEKMMQDLKTLRRNIDDVIRESEYYVTIDNPSLNPMIRSRQKKVKAQESERRHTIISFLTYGAYNQFKDTEKSLLKYFETSKHSFHFILKPKEPKQKK